MSEKFSTALLKWYNQNGRLELPWRQQITPYRVWLSEIMLQQTQVKTVLPYFLKFLQHFPTIEDLAKSSLDSVLSQWAGLGYYTRARNLHRCAKIIRQQYMNQFPTTVQQLVELPGIGLTTAHAICAICFNQSTPILDGNVKRILSRYYGIFGDPSSSKVNKTLWGKATEIMPKKHTNDYTQAIMDLGATCCTRNNPSCQQCPVHTNCYAHLHKATAQLPSAKKKIKRHIRSCYLLIFKRKSQEGHIEIFLHKRPHKGIWGGLWSLPETDTIETTHKLLGDLNVKHNQVVKLPALLHQFTHIKLTATPIIIPIHHQKLPFDGGVWYCLENITVGIPQLIKKVLSQL